MAKVKIYRDQKIIIENDFIDETIENVKEIVCESIKTDHPLCISKADGSVSIINFKSVDAVEIMD